LKKKIVAASSSQGAPDPATTSEDAKAPERTSPRTGDDKEKKGDKPDKSKKPSRGQVILPSSASLPIDEKVSSWQEYSSEWQVTYADGSWKPKSLQEVGDCDILHPQTKRWIARLLKPGHNIRVKTPGPKGKSYPFKIKSVSDDCEILTGYYYHSYKEGSSIKWKISPFQLAYDVGVDEFEEVLKKTSRHGHGRFKDVGVTFDRM
jgi:hypothetical protein